MSTRPDVHSGLGLEAYVQGMARSKGDKARMLPHVRPGRILELGCGSGAVLELLRGFSPASELVGIDLSAKLLGVAARSLQGAARLRRRDLFALAHDPGLLGEGPFDTVILCSTLHELATFALEHPERFPGHPEGPMAEAAARIFGLARALLAEGGVLVVRDGVQPERRPLRLRFRSPELEERFWRFADDFRPFTLEFSVSDGLYTLPSDHLYEFATKYFYETNWHVEVGEYFGWASGRQLEALLRQAGLEPVHREAYTIPFLAEKWAADLEISDLEGRPYTLPSTQILVARKG
ncbi:methyltransferase [Calidithermus chliarophilus]|uniref:methyltransferase n=1 Tax=Calidithermus chliarophilus TaxID=52023 RepID=UPI000481CE38|nr:methyltransferase domain-containing protein [Calidithermus chliarophilus]